MGSMSVTSDDHLLAKLTSVGNVVLHVVRAAAGLAVAYVLSRFMATQITDAATVDRRGMIVELPAFIVVASIALTFTSALPLLKDLLDVKGLVTSKERDLRGRAVDQTFQRDVQDAFEMAENEADLFEICGVALGKVATSDLGGSEILIADSSGAHLEKAVVSDVGSAPECGVLTPGGCPAVRRGQTLRFADPHGLASCPRLREREIPIGMGATCVPVTVLGKPTAVLHSTYEFIEDDQDYEKKVTALEGVAGQFGTNVGMMRAMSQSQMQADTDPLTGLLNRRAMENQVRELRGEGQEFALAMLDLDNFKNLNDTFGHDTGDRALRLFSRVLAASVRDGDLVCRHGGEEFVVVLAGADVASASPVFHRLRERLAEEVAGSQVPAFTVSIGLCDSTWSEDLQTVVQSADRALMLAKTQGRDCLVIDDPAEVSTGSDAPLVIEPAGKPVDGS